MSPPHFPIGPEGLNGSWQFDFIDEGSFDLEGLTVVARAIPHKGGRTFGYRISDGDGTVVYMPDHLPAADGPTRQAALDLAHDADLLIHDSQFVTAEHVLAEQYGHSTQPQAIDLAVAAGVGNWCCSITRRRAPTIELELLFDELGERRFGSLTIALGREGDEFSRRGRKRCRESGSRHRAGGVGRLKPIAAPPPSGRRTVRRVDRSAEPLDDLADDRQAETRPRHGACRVGPMEPIEHLRQIGRRDARSRGRGRSARSFDDDVDRAGRLIELAGVVDEIGDRSIEPGAAVHRPSTTAAPVTVTTRDRRRPTRRAASVANSTRSRRSDG